MLIKPELLELLSVLLLTSLLWMLLGYFLQRKLKDMGLVDFFWASGVGIGCLIFFSFSEGLLIRQALALCIGIFWSLRLAWHLLRDRILREGEDPRYAALRDRWGDKVQSRFFAIFLFQAMLIVFFAGAFWVPMNSEAPWAWTDAIGGLWALMCVLGESTADRQLRQFKSRSANQGRTCEEGLWAYSRHPNYFFEWLFWFAPLWLSIAHPFWWISLLAPFAMLVFLYKITGIPYTEKQALKSRPDSYARYQKRVSAFFPWFPRKD